MKQSPKTDPNDSQHKILIDWDEFDKLCQLQCTEEEIADWFGCTIETLNEKIKDKYKITFLEIFQQKRGKGKIALRRKQMQVALEGDKTLLIWLGKQYLKQKEKQLVEHEGDVQITVKYDES